MPSRIHFLVSCRTLGSGLILAALLLPVGTFANNLHLIEALPNGFAIYRTGKPDADDLAEIRELGVSEMVVLSGNADKHESEHLDVYPELKVVYNEKQSTQRLPDDEFLDWFDSWVEQARREGRKIAFRCNCGCHRTGRLAAYYQMKWQNLSLEDALIIMNNHGKRMGWYPTLPDQVRDLQVRIENQQGSAAVPSARR
ncbi:MAG: dual specificity protein phosphatase family protein [bacterium]